MEEIDCVVAGAGVVGLAIARRLAEGGREVVVLEAAEGIGTVTSARNSEVIHAGIHYKPGSLRARLCRPGRDALYAYCRERGIPHRRCGKLIVAADETEAEALSLIASSARQNGVEDLVLLSGEQARTMEPALACVAALHSPSTGIIDSHSYMLALRGDLEDHGGMVAFGSPIEQLRPAGDGWDAAIGGNDPQWLSFDAVINCAGLGAQRLARATESYPAERVPRLVLAKGSYFSFAGRPAFSRLIYPVPVPGGLGVHVTLDLAGRMRFGPDVEWIEGENYDVDPARAQAFYARIRDYWPKLPDGSLGADFAGMRPKLTGPGEAAADFLIEGPRQHGRPGLVHMFGIESPGLTSALSLADEVVSYLSS
jgi:L-2-hydroxyglutarate oxidase LhgO